MTGIQFSSRTEFSKTIEKGVALVDFNAPWCAPCRAMAPVIAKITDTYEGRAKIFEVNIDENREIAMHFKIQSIPTIIVFKQGVEQKRFIGIQSLDTLENVLAEIIDLEI